MIQTRLLKCPHKFLSLEEQVALVLAQVEVLEEVEVFGAGHGCVL